MILIQIFLIIKKNKIVSINLMFIKSTLLRYNIKQTLLTSLI